MGLVLVAAAWSAGCDLLTPHTVSVPDIPSGPATGVVGEELTFSIVGAACSRGHAVEYRFSWGDGTFSNWSTSTSASTSWSQPGTVEVTAQARCASDVSVLSGWSVALSVLISAPAVESPTAQFTVSPASPTVGQTVTFDGGSSSATQGSLVSYNWQFGDGATGSGITATHVYGASGTYTVRLTVTDSQAATGTASQQLVITPEETTESPPVVLTARILNDGSAWASPDVVSASRTAEGAYRIQFTRDVANDIMVATSTQSTAHPLTLSVITGPRYGDPRDTVTVHVFDKDGNKANGSFRMSVISAGESIPHPTLTARIAQDGSAIGSPDVVSASRTALGTYRIQFTRDMTDDITVATSTQSGTQLRTISLIAGPRHGFSRDTLLVYMFDENGSRADGSFHVAVIGSGEATPRPALTARILSDGRAVTSPDVVSVSRTALGTYRIQFTRDVADHRIVGTSTQSSIAQRTLSVITGPRYGDPRNTVTVHVFDKDGNKADGSFHLLVVQP